MGVNIKTAGGICIGGIVGFYLINKALNFTRQSIAEITEASKWKAYYKNGHMGKMIPPGYSEMPVPGQEDREYVHPDVAAKREREEEAAQRKAERAEREANRKPMDQNVVDSITDTIERIAKAYFRTKGINLDIPNKPLTSYDNVVSYTDYYQKKQLEKDDILPVAEAVNSGDTDGDGEVHQVSINELVDESFRNDIPDGTVEVEAEAEVEIEVPDNNKNDITEE